MDNTQTASNERGQLELRSSSAPPRPPLDDQGRFAGDLNYHSLWVLVKREEHDRSWQEIAVELGLAPPPVDVHVPSAHYRQGRCYCAMHTAGVWHLSELRSILEDTPLKREFLKSVSQFSTLAGHRVVALPEDVLTLLVVYGRRSFFGDGRLQDLGFKSQITDALADVLPIHALMGEQQRSEFTHKDGEPPHRDGEG